MNDTHCRGAWDKGCTDNMYVHDYWVSKLPNNLPSYTTKGKLWKYIATEKFKFSLQDLNSNSHHRNSMCYHWATTSLYLDAWWNCTFRTLIIKYIYLTNPKSCERPVSHSVSISNSRCLVKLYLSRLDPDNSLDLGPHSIVWYQCGNYRLNLHSILLYLLYNYKYPPVRPSVRLTVCLYKSMKLSVKIRLVYKYLYFSRPSVGQATKNRNVF